MWNPLLDDPIARFERQIAWLGSRLGAVEHQASRLGDEDRSRLRPTLHRLDDELWRIDLRVASRGSDPLLLERELAILGAEIADVEREVERCRSTRSADVIPLVPRDERSVA